MPSLAPGQVWTYRTRPGEEASRVTVLQLDPHDEFGHIVHVRFDGVAIRSPLAPDGVSRIIAHMPFSLEAVERSLTALESEGGALPEFADGYAQWKVAFDHGRGGVFTATLAEAVQHCEEAMNNAEPAKPAKPRKEKN
jgi:hypothetical protein